MCTVTVVPLGGMVRVACNRDESRRRPHAHPPFITIVDGLQVLTPLDPQGRGTWIAANNAGLVFALLNVQPAREATTAEGPSRGLIIPHVSGSASLEEVLDRVNTLPDGVFAPCRLLALDGEQLLHIRLAPPRRSYELLAVDLPLLFTSSSLGDALVDGPRRLLFEQMMAAGGDPGAQQDAFHAHRWRDRPAVSVHMSRPDACTVSTTIVEVTTQEVRMVYQPAHCFDGTPVGLVIERQPVEHHASRRPRREHAAV